MNAFPFGSNPQPELPPCIVERPVDPRTIRQEHESPGDVAARLAAGQLAMELTVGLGMPVAPPEGVEPAI